jgi:hypothetical protein
VHLKLQTIRAQQIVMSKQVHQEQHAKGMGELLTGTRDMQPG